MDDSDDDEIYPVPISQRGKNHSTRIQKLRNITGRTDSLTVLQDYLNPESLEDAKKSREAIESSDRLKRRLGERPPTSANPRPSHSISRDEDDDTGMTDSTGGGGSPSGPRSPVTGAGGEPRRNSVGARRSSVDNGKITKKKAAGRRDSREITSYLPDDPSLQHSGEGGGARESQ